MKIAIMGLRHGHVGDLIARIRDRDNTELVAICEEDAATREAAQPNHDLPIYDSYEKMLDEVECDAIGIGDYFGKRGAIAITALERGKHVIADKPLCTSLAELDTIAELARAKQLSIGCMLDMRDGAAFLALRALADGGELGRVHAISFGGQHPLNWGTRAGWYFEEGKHGGTITDIAIHAIDWLPVLTGRRIARINAARNWNARLTQVPHFKDAAQMMLTLEDGCGVLGDVSYLLPDSFGYSHPFYWRITLWGENGVAETNSGTGEVVFYQNGADGPRDVAKPDARPGGYLDAFLSEVRGVPQELNTATVLQSTRNALLVQQAADEGLTNVDID